MNFSKIFLFFLICVIAVFSVTAMPDPRWKKWKRPFKKIEKIGQHIRDGVIKAGPAVIVAGQAAALG